MSWDVDEVEFYETFAEIAEDRGLEDAKKWAWSALDRPQMELRESEKEIKELLKHRESCADNLLKGYETGKTEERAAVVAWLLEQALQSHPDAAGWFVLNHVSVMIERGEHHSAENDQKCQE